MRKFIYAFLLTLITLPGMAQEDNNIWILGHFKNALTRESIADVTVTLMRPDSTVIATMQSAENLNNLGSGYYFANQKEGTYILKLEHPDFETKYQKLIVKVKNKRQRSFQADLIYLTRKPKDYSLEGVTVTATKIKMVQRGDTIVYDADAFKMSKGSMLDALIEQLPGAKLDENGVITINGKAVNSILLNGKDFMKGNSNIVLQNLPAYTVNKIKVYEKAPDRLMALGMAKVAQDKDKEYVLDVNLKKEYSIGWMGNATIGGGTEKRYEGKLFGVSYGKRERLGLYGNINNLNESRRPGLRNGHWSPATAYNGLKTTATGGVDFLYEEAEGKTGWTVELGAHATKEDAEEDYTKAHTNFMTGGDFYKRGWQNDRNKNWSIASNNWNVGYIKPNRWNLNISPYLSYNRYDNDARRLYGTLYDDLGSTDVRQSLARIFAGDTTLRVTNHERYTSANSGYNINAGLSASISGRPNPHLFDSYMVSINASFNRNTSDTYMQQGIHYPLSGDAPTYLHRYTDGYGRSRNFGGNAAYTFHIPLSKNFTDNDIFLQTNYSYQHSNSDTHNLLYDLHKQSGWGVADSIPLTRLPSSLTQLQAVINDNSNIQGQIQNVHTIGAGISGIRTINGNNLGYSIHLPVTYTARQMDYKRGPQHFTPSDHRWTINPGVQLEWRMPQKNWESELKYTVTVTAPSLYNTMAIRNDANPLSIWEGNPHLKNSVYHHLYFRHNTKITSIEQSLTIGGWYTQTQNAHATDYRYDATTGVSTTTPTNVNGNKHVMSYVNFERAFGKANRFTFHAYTSGRWFRNVDLSRYDNAPVSTPSIVHTWEWREDFEVAYRLPEPLRGRIGASFIGTYRHTGSSRKDFQTLKVGDYRYGIHGRINWGFLELNTDLNMYSRRGYGSSEMNTNDLVWNAGISAQLPKQWTVSIEGYDILGKLSNVQYYVDGQGRTATQFNRVLRYAMLKAKYQFHLSPKTRK